MLDTRGVFVARGVFEAGGVFVVRGVFMAEGVFVGVFTRSLRGDLLSLILLEVRAGISLVFSIFTPCKHTITTY